MKSDTDMQEMLGRDVIVLASHHQDVLVGTLGVVEMIVGEGFAVSFALPFAKANDPNTRKMEKRTVWFGFDELRPATDEDYNRIKAAAYDAIQRKLANQ